MVRLGVFNVRDGLKEESFKNWRDDGNGCSFWNCSWGGDE